METSRTEPIEFDVFEAVCGADGDFVYCDAVMPGTDPSKGLGCTRRENHDGDHVAVWLGRVGGDSSRLMARWSDDGKPPIGWGGK